MVVKRTFEQREIIELQKKRVEIEYGSVVKAKVRFVGSEHGEVSVKAGELELQCPDLEWTPNRIMFQLPDVQVLDDAEVLLTMFKASDDQSNH